MKRLFTLSFLSAALLSSCGVLDSLTTPGEYMPIYLQEPSPLDPPGMDAVRAEARAKYVKEGLYADGETLDVQQGKAYLFNRNPDYYEGAKGRMVDTATARIISCEGLYYFVEIEDGSKGFLRETDFVNPVKLVSTAEILGDGKMTVIAGHGAEEFHFRQSFLRRYPENRREKQREYQNILRDSSRAPQGRFRREFFRSLRRPPR